MKKKNTVYYAVSHIKDPFTKGANVHLSLYADTRELKKHTHKGQETGRLTVSIMKKYDLTSHSFGFHFNVNAPWDEKTYRVFNHIFAQYKNMIMSPEAKALQTEQDAAHDYMIKCIEEGSNDFPGADQLFYLDIDV
jgi:hypothetical protein